MVLPPSPPDDAPRAAEERWLDSLKFALRLSRAGLLLLVDHARQESLGELVEALAPEHPELDVHTDVRRMLEVPHGSTVVLVPRVEDADWLNINRPLFAQRELKVVLFCDTETSIALAQRAVDFFDWISHRVECPNRPPRFAVAGIRTVLAARAPGIIWTGGDLRAAFAAARPHGKLHEVSAALPYSKMVDEIREHRHAWIAWTKVDNYFRLRRVRWAHAEAGHRTRAILVEPAAPSPGWWPVHGRMVDVREARARLERAGVKFPGRVAALHDFEPEAIALIESQGQLPIEALPGKTASSSHAPKLAIPSELDAAKIFRGEAVPHAPRALKPAQLRQLCFQEFSTLGQRIAEEQQPEPADISSWIAWSAAIPSDVRMESIASRFLEKVGPAYAVELLLSRTINVSNKWIALTVHATSLHDLNAAEYWSRRALATEQSEAQSMLALVRSLQGHPNEAELLLREQLRAGAHSPDTDMASRSTLLTSLASVLRVQEKHHEAEELLRAELARSTQPQLLDAPTRRSLLYNLATALRMQRNYSEAEIIIRQALEDHPSHSSEDRITMGAWLDELARILVARGKDDEAERVLGKALGLLSSTVGTGHPVYGAALLSLTNILVRNGRQGEAEEALRQAISASERNRDEESPFHSNLLSVLASILISQGKYAEAETILMRALRIRDTFSITAPQTGGLILHQLANTLLFQGRYGEAEQLLYQVLALTEQGHGLQAIQLRPSLLGLGYVLWKQGRANEAEPFLVRSFEIFRANQQQADVSILRELSVLSSIQRDLNKPQANDTARTALKILDQTPGLEQSVPQDIIDNLKAIAQAPTNS